MGGLGLAPENSASNGSNHGRCHGQSLVKTRMARFLFYVGQGDDFTSVLCGPGLNGVRRLYSGRHIAVTVSWRLTGAFTIESPGP